MERTFLEMVEKPDVNITENDISIMYEDGLQAAYVSYAKGPSIEYFMGEEYMQDPTILTIPLLYGEVVNINMNMIYHKQNQIYAYKFFTLVSNLILPCDFSVFICLNSISIEIPILYKNCIFKEPCSYSTNNKLEDCYRE